MHQVKISQEENQSFFKNELCMKRWFIPFGKVSNKKIMFVTFYNK